jgi:Tol biopolymer transport system component
LFDLDRSSLTQVTENSVDDRHPAWFTSGDGLVFSRNEGGDFELYALDLGKGARLRRLTDNRSEDDDPALH